MRFYPKSALFFLLLYLAAVCPGLAQEKRSSSNGTDRVTRRGAADQQNLAVHRLLTPNEGLAVLGAALDSRHSHADFAADCSHFVHGLYERAGFSYEYGSFSDLYAGIDEFRRAASPQPGDLAVWPGHAGIVVNHPAESPAAGRLRRAEGRRERCPT